MVEWSEHFRLKGKTVMFGGYADVFVGFLAKEFLDLFSLVS
jgi:hypothetical protein